ncbi:PREDICTED: pyrroline-5-carboxylate reductase 2-like isoform X2 [Priapulus caudatus]|nr:PREDICTED: pyrroline-5-carboxylate reductase 2-like isoform X2 [Priapulus caudatus]XP_014672912.1 PREDICTED: pyrroline-5-carboxylate reductase 2-like isoform X2 [Priapulus caudatus]
MSSPQSESQELKDAGINFNRDNVHVVKTSSIIIIAVKPHIVPCVVQEIAPYMKRDCHLVMSVAAGIKLEYYEKALKVGVVRVTPNTPALVGEGVSAFTLGTHCKKSVSGVVKQMLSCVGLCEEVPEKLQDTVTGISGSGPAYICIVIESLADGAVKMGMPREMALKFAAQTVKGAAKLLLETGKHPGELKDEVCSPGGTTIAAIHQLERAGLRAALMDAVETSTLKSREIGGHY